MYSEYLNFDQCQIHLSTLALLFPNCPCFLQLSQNYTHWIGYFGNSHFSRSSMFTQAATVFKFQLRVRARNLSEACQNPTLVNEEKSLSRLSDAPCWPSCLSREASFPAPWGTYCRQLGVHKIARRSTELGPLEIRNLYNQRVAFPSKKHTPNRHSNETKGF